jgi:Ras-related protein Rab-7A
MERFHQGTIGTPFYRGAHGCLLVYDVTNEKSIEQLALWRDELMSKVENSEAGFPIVVVGNKTDQRTPESTYDQSMVLKWCRDNEYGHIETSAKDETGVQAAMTAIAALALEQQKSSSRKRVDSRRADVIKVSDMYSKPSRGCGCS